jgi:hypothetical protein
MVSTSSLPKDLEPLEQLDYLRGLAFEVHAFLQDYATLADWVPDP